MKKLVLAAAFVGAASTASAGNISAPIIETAPELIVADTAASSSSNGLILPLIIVALLVAAAAS